MFFLLLNICHVCNSSVGRIRSSFWTNFQFFLKFKTTIEFIYTDEHFLQYSLLVQLQVQFVNFDTVLSQIKWSKLCT